MMSNLVHTPLVSPRYRCFYLDSRVKQLIQYKIICFHIFCIIVIGNTDIDQLINLEYSIDFSEPIPKMVERLTVKGFHAKVAGILMMCIGGLSLRLKTYYFLS